MISRRNLLNFIPYAGIAAGRSEPNKREPSKPEPIKRRPSKREPSSQLLSVTGYTVTPSGDTTGAADTAAITAALGDAGAGGVVALSPGVFYTGGPLTVPSGVALAGTHGAQGSANEVGTTLAAASGFTGAAMITFAGSSYEQTIADLNLDATALPASSTVGISAAGLVVTGLRDRKSVV